MPWVRFDDQFTIHRKIARLSDAAFRLHVAAIFWSSRNLTDGYVSVEDLKDLNSKSRSPSKFVAELVSRGLWHPAGEKCGSETCSAPTSDGWVIHDYLGFQFSKDRVIKRRDADAKRQQKLRENRQGNGVSNGVTHGGSNGVSHRRSHSVPTRPDPIPPSPPSRTAPLAGLGLTAEEERRVLETIHEHHHDIRNEAALIRTLVDNGTIHRYIAEARTVIEAKRPRTTVPTHPFKPDRNGIACEHPGCGLLRKHVVHPRTETGETAA